MIPTQSSGAHMRSAVSVVALGGGHGLAASLSALRHLTDQLTAVVTVADNGGSSGRLRAEMGGFPPGDLRMALSALCDDSEWGRTWRDVLQHRFHSEGDLNGHAVGNLLISALWQILDDPVAGLDWVARLLGARGRVLPMAAVPLDILAKVRGMNPQRPHQIDIVRGQAAVAKTPGTVLEVSLEPPSPPACEEAVSAVLEADWVILGPGSWFTSVVPHLLVPDLAKALQETQAKICVTLNLDPHSSETQGFELYKHLEVLQHCAPDMRIDAVVADPASVDDKQGLRDAVAALGGRLVLQQIAASGRSAVHDPLRLAGAYRDLFDDVTSGPSGLG